MQNLCKRVYAFCKSFVLRVAYLFDRGKIISSLLVTVKNLAKILNLFRVKT